jgi:hypothetical protein
MVSVAVDDAAALPAAVGVHKLSPRTESGRFAGRSNKCTPRDGLRPAAPPFICTCTDRRCTQVIRRTPWGSETRFVPGERRQLVGR